MTATATPQVAPAWQNGQLNHLADSGPHLPEHLRQLVAEHTAAFFTWQAAITATKAAEAALVAAQRADQGARVAKLRRRAEAAPKPQTPGAEADLAAARQHRADCALAVVQVETEIQRAVVDAAWTAELDAAIAEARDAIAEAVETIEARLRAESRLRWLRGIASGAVTVGRGGAIRPELTGAGIAAAIRKTITEARANPSIGLEAHTAETRAKADAEARARGDLSRTTPEPGATTVRIMDDGTPFLGSIGAA